MNFKKFKINILYLSKKLAVLIFLAKNLYDNRYMYVHSTKICIFANNRYGFSC